MSFEPAALFAGLFFGTLGIYVIKEGKRLSNFGKVLVGIALLVYPYFIESAAASWLVGGALFALSFRL